MAKVFFGCEREAQLLFTRFRSGEYGIHSGSDGGIHFTQAEGERIWAEWTRAMIRDGHIGWIAQILDGLGFRLALPQPPAAPGDPFADGDLGNNVDADHHERARAGEAH